MTPRETLIGYLTTVARVSGQALSPDWGFPNLIFLVTPLKKTASFGQINGISINR